MQKRYSKVIVDNVQVFFTLPVEGTCVASDISATDEEFEHDRSAGRAEYLVGRIERTAPRREYFL